MNEGAIVVRMEGIVPRVDDAQARADALVIASDADYEAGAEVVRGLKALASEVRATFADAKRKAHEAHKAVVAAEARHLEPLEQAERVVRRKLGAYADQRERERRAAALEAERAAREAEEALRLAEAEALEAAGDGEGALAMLEAPMPVPVAPVERLAAPGVSTRETWHAEVTDLRALVAEVAAGRAPLTLLKLDEVAAGNWARSTRGSVAVPGLRVFSRTGVAVRS